MSLKPMFFVLRVELCVFAETLVERKKKKYHVTMDRVRCKLLAVWKTCVQTDWQTGCGGAISGVELEDRAARDERRRVTGPAVTLFKTLSPSPFFIPPPLPFHQPSHPSRKPRFLSSAGPYEEKDEFCCCFKGILHWIICLLPSKARKEPLKSYDGFVRKPRTQTDILKCLVLSDQQSKTQKILKFTMI